LGGGETKGRDHCPPTEEIDRNRGILHNGMDSKQEPEDIKDIVSVVSQSERVHNRVEMNDGKHDWYNDQRGQDTRESLLFLWKSIIEIPGEYAPRKKNIEHGNDQDRPGEENEVGPDVEHLSQVHTGGMELLVSYPRNVREFRNANTLQRMLTQDDTVVPENKCTKCPEDDDVGKDRSNNREWVPKTRDCEGDGGLEIIYIKLAVHWSNVENTTYLEGKPPIPMDRKSRPADHA